MLVLHTLSRLWDPFQRTFEQFSWGFLECQPLAKSHLQHVS